MLKFVIRESLFPRNVEICHSRKFIPVKVYSAKVYYLRYASSMLLLGLSNRKKYIKVMVPYKLIFAELNFAEITSVIFAKIKKNKPFKLRRSLYNGIKHQNIVFTRRNKNTICNKTLQINVKCYPESDKNG